MCGDYGHTNGRGTECRNHVVRGTTACKWHAGKALAKHMADGALRRAVDDWGISRNEYIDPGDTLLRLIAASARRAQRYADAIAHLIEQTGVHGVDAELKVLLAPEYAVTKEGDKVKIGLQFSALTKLESDERDRLANWCRIAIAAGLEERRVKMAEQQGAQLAAVVRQFAQRLQLTAEQSALIPEALRGAVADIFGRPQAIDGEVV